MFPDASLDFALRLLLRAMTELIGEVRSLRISIETHRASVDASLNSTNDADFIAEVRALRTSVEMHRASVDAFTNATKDAAKEGFWPWARSNPGPAFGIALLVVLALQGQAVQIVPLVLTHFWGSSNVHP
jgi:hypothetical protein